ncbi:hypothetical protein B0H16DRAFT_1537987 [Mycena metata]|uniref:Uncharacterized protein n=1 Tax=Mycena metata TaxID=1033252 RepID=A0AAD7J506_9AGAR|nr:hypothetical protein B0H16DRAFT_1537987 [Mycena metata]
MGGMKEKKKRTGYPSVGIRVRPGVVPGSKDASSPVSPLSATAGSRRGSGGVNAKSPLARQQVEEGYYPHQQQAQQQQHGQQQVPQHQHQQQHQLQQSQMEAYRSRSSSISQDPRMQPPKDQPVVAMSFTVPFSSSSPHTNPAMDSGEYNRRSFAEPPPPQQQMPPPQQQPQGYAGDAASAAMFDLQPRAGSYDADPAYGGSVGSPYGNSSSAGGGMSAASSPYTNTSGGASASTPTFGNGGNSVSSHPSPPYAASPRFAPQPPGYYAHAAHTPGAGYDAGAQQQQQQQQQYVGDAGTQMVGGYGDVKPLPPHSLHGHAPHHAQYAHHEQPPPRHGHDMAWPSAEPAQTTYWPQPLPDYMTYPQ